MPFPGEEQKNYGYKVGYPGNVGQDFEQADADMLIFIQIYHTLHQKSKFPRISVLLPTGRDDVVFVPGGGGDHPVYYDPVVHDDVALGVHGSELQNLLTFSVYAHEHQGAYVGIVVSRVNAQTCTTGLGQHFLDDFTANQVPISLVRVSVIVSFYHPGAGFGTDVLTYGGTEGTCGNCGVEYILVHGIHFGG